MELVSSAEGTVTINTDPVITGSAFGINRTRNVMQKSFVGQTSGHALGGQLRLSFSASGSVDAETYAQLEEAFAAGEVPFSLQIGTAAAATDAGLYSGTLVIGSLNVTVNGDGEWDWALEAQSTGAVTFTPAGS